MQKDASNSSPRGVSRRSLGRNAALSAAALALGQAAAENRAAAPAAPPPQGRGQAALPAADQAEVDAKFAEIVRKYGDRLSDDQKTRVRSTLANHQRMLSRIRAFPLENSDAPATGLRLYPNDTAVSKKG